MKRPILKEQRSCKKWQGTLEKPLELTMEYVLTRIDQIMKDTEHIYKVILSNVIPEICI
ncbi:MAG TPA: hypothetical protein VFD03_06415 [Clostridia bacterium]|nr:hypothetical protein [Clostridia bacterium]